MRYIKQRDTYSCGSVAVINALKWAGYKITYNSHIKRIKKLTRNNIDGVRNEDMIKALRKYKGIKATFKRSISLKEANKQLEKGNSLIIGFDYRDKYNEWCGHSIFVASKIDKQYKVVNDFEATALTFDKWEMKEVLKYRGYSHSPVAWVIRCVK